MCGVNSLIKHLLSTQQALHREDRMKEARPCQEALWLAPGPVGSGLHPFPFDRVSSSLSWLRPGWAHSASSVPCWCNAFLRPPLFTAAQLDAPHPSSDPAPRLPGHLSFPSTEVAAATCLPTQRAPCILEDKRVHGDLCSPRSS